MAEEMNRKLAKFCPELSSQYALCPMEHSRWLDPKEKDPQGKPCFVQGPDAGPKLNYVFGPGKYGLGYYHLLTKFSYAILKARLSHEYPGGCCACSAAARKEVDEYEDVKRIVHARSLASIPNDRQAYQESISDATQIAQAHYQGTQIEAVAVHGVVTAANFMR